MAPRSQTCEVINHATNHQQLRWRNRKHSSMLLNCHLVHTLKWQNHYVNFIRKAPEQCLPGPLNRHRRPVSSLRLPPSPPNRSRRRSRHRQCDGDLYGMKSELDPMILTARLDRTFASLALLIQIRLGLVALSILHLLAVLGLRQLLSITVAGLNQNNLWQTEWRKPYPSPHSSATFAACEDEEPSPSSTRKHGAPACHSLAPRHHDPHPTKRLH